MIRFNPVLGEPDVAFQLRIAQILQRVGAAYQPVIFKLCLPGRISRDVRAQFADKRPLGHFFQPQSGDDAIEITFLADNKVPVNMSGGLDQAFL